MTGYSYDFLLDSRTKGIPVHAGKFSAADISEQEFVPANGRLQYPILTLDERTFTQNLNEMLAYAAEHGAVLAPHGKTPMAPQLAHRVVEAGGWGVSSASLQQTTVFLEAGLKNVILANQVGARDSVAQLASLAKMYPDAALLCFVDSLDAIAAFNGLLEGVSNLGLLVETGVPGGRNGHRDCASALDALELIESLLGAERIAGVAAYEGAALGPDMAKSVSAADELMALTAQTFMSARQKNPDRELVLTAGGSVLYDLVTSRLGPVAAADGNTRFVLRGGAFLFHDHGIYDRLIHEMDARSGYRRNGKVASAAATYQPALRLWAQVQSRPEPDLAIAGFGMRDTSHDVGLPTVLCIHRDGEQVATSQSAPVDVTVQKLNDQHGFLKIDPETDLRVGDILEMGISHPCTCLDKWRVIYGIDANGMIVAAYQTYF